MGTKMEEKSFFGIPGTEYFEASDGKGHHGEGYTPEEAQSWLEEAQSSGNAWEKPLGSGPKVDNDK